MKTIHQMVIEDIAGRAEVGLAEYGVPLTRETPIDSLVYAYEEALDLACYLRKAIEERG